MKRIVDFSDAALTTMHRIAPLDTWAIFVEQDQENLARKMLDSFRRCMQNIESGNSVTKAPKIFTVPRANSGEAELCNAWKNELILKVRVYSKMQAQVVILINPVVRDMQQHVRFRD